MKKKYWLFATMASPLLSSCLCFEPFQPNPPAYKDWSKKGVGELDVKKAMLECGYPTPYEVTLGRSVSPPETVAMMNMCMKYNGFTRDKGRYDFCNQWKELRACQPGATIPHRNVDKRINGPFCKAHSTEEVCQR